MRYWWVNQNQTYKQELGGGYLWSPKRNANGARNPFYESMREVAPGDLVFSFVDTRILAIGIAESYCYESPKPAEFGSAGLNWEKIGWRIPLCRPSVCLRQRRCIRPMMLNWRNSGTCGVPGASSTAPPDRLPSHHHVILSIQHRLLPYTRNGT